MINIGWVIDNKYRELQRLIFLKNNLKKKGLNLILFNKFNYKLGIQSHSLSALVIPNLWNFGLQIINIAKKYKVPKIYLYHVEVFQESKKVLSEKYPKHALKNIDFIFCQSQLEYDFLIDQNFNQCIFTGVYKYYNTALYENKFDKKVIGVTSTGKYLANPSNLSLIHIINRRDGNEWIRDTLKYEVEYICFIKQLKEICEKNDYKILFRPHPFEDYKKYELLENQNFQIDRSYNMNNFLKKIDILLNHISSSSYDAILNNVPVINIENFFTRLKAYEDADLYEFPPVKIGKKINSLKEIFEILEDEKKINDLKNESLNLQKDIKLKIFNNNQDPLSIIFAHLSKERNSQNNSMKYFFFIIFFLKQIITNFKRNKYGFFNLYNILDNKLLDKINKS